jgi:hypothetical protein
VLLTSLVAVHRVPLPVLHLKSEAVVAWSDQICSTTRVNTVICNPGLGGVPFTLHSWPTTLNIKKNTAQPPWCYHVFNIDLAIYINCTHVRARSHLQCNSFDSIPPQNPWQHTNTIIVHNLLVLFEHNLP